MRKEYIILASVLLLVVALTGIKYSQTHPVIEVSKNFIMAAAEGNNTKPYAVLATQKKPAPAQVDSIECHVLAYGSRWAKTQVKIELTLADQAADVNWYELELSKSDGWKVTGINKISPAIDGFSFRLSEESQNDIKDVFSSYLTTLQGADYKDTKRYLAGPAREKFEQYLPEAGSAPMFKSFTSIQIDPLWTDKKYAVARINYLLDGRKVEVIVGFYETKQGWKIVTTK